MFLRKSWIPTAWHEARKKNTMITEKPQWGITTIPPPPPPPPRDSTSGRCAPVSGSQRPPPAQKQPPSQIDAPTQQRADMNASQTASL